MSGIFYDPAARRLHRVSGEAPRGWRFVTHDLGASTHRCRRIMREWAGYTDIKDLNWSPEHNEQRSA